METEETPQAELANEPTAPVIEDKTTSEGLETKEDSKPKEEGHKEKYSRRVEKSIGRYKYQAEETGRELTAANARIAELEQGQRLPSEPLRENYATEEEHERDTKRWSKQNEQDIRADERAKVQAGNQEREQLRRQQKVSDRYGVDRLEGAKKFDNYQRSENEILAVVQRDGAWAMRDAIIGSKKNSAEIVNYLGNNLDELDEIASLSRDEQIREIFEIEQKVKAKAPKTVSDAPEPAGKVTGGANSGETSKVSQREWNMKKNRR